MKTALIILSQTLILGGFLYFMFSESQQAPNQDFLKDSIDIVTVPHQYPTTNQPSTETPDQRPTGTNPTTPNRPEDSSPTPTNPDQPSSSEPTTETPNESSSPENPPEDTPASTPQNPQPPSEGTETSTTNPDEPTSNNPPEDVPTSTTPATNSPNPDEPTTDTPPEDSNPTTSSPNPDESTSSPPEEIPPSTSPATEPSATEPPTTEESSSPNTPSEDTPASSSTNPDEPATSTPPDQTPDSSSATNPDQPPSTETPPEGTPEEPATSNPPEDIPANPPTIPATGSPDQPSSSEGSSKEGNISVKGSENQVQVIFKSRSDSTSQGYRCKQITQRSVTLCDIGFKNNCKRRHVTEEVPSFWMISPIYTANNDQTKHLYELHNNFRDYVKSYGINFQTVEVVFPGQEFQLTKPNNEPYELQYHSDWIFAMRENLVNVGIKHLPDDWQYMAWIDQHIFWLDPYWFEKTILAFGHYNIVQMLNGNDFWNLRNTSDYHLDGYARIYNEVGMGFEQHDPRQCGLAWGMRRDIFERLGGLLDICIGTKCDLYQNYAYAGRRYTYQTGNSEYAEMIGQWQDHAIQVYDRKLGFVDTKVVHFMHCYDGCKTSDYNLQIYALMRHNYNPKYHIQRDQEGRMSLVNNLDLAKELWSLYGGPPRDQ